MKLLTSKFLISMLAIAVVGSVVSVPAAADSKIGCASGTRVDATLKVDGVSTTVNSASDRYALVVCRDTRMGSYMIQVGRQDNGVLRDELTADDSEKVFVVTFSPEDQDIITVASFYGRVQFFDIGKSVVVSVKPTSLSKVDDPERACDRKEFTDANCIARPATRDLSAIVLGYVRFDASASSYFGKLKGSYIGASANMFDFSLLGPCPTVLVKSDDESKSNEDLSTSLAVKMHGPHFKFDKTTLNVGSLEINIPEATITECFGGTAEELEKQLGLTRVEAGETKDLQEVESAPASSLQYRTSITGGALRISVSAISFSSPTYNVKMMISPSAISKAKSALTKNLNLSRSSSMSATAIAALTKLKIAKGSKVSIKIDRSTTKFCKVTGSLVKGLKKGTCKIIVTVKPAVGKSKSETISLKVL